MRAHGKSVESYTRTALSRVTLTRESLRNHTYLVAHLKPSQDNFIARYRAFQDILLTYFRVLQGNFVADSRAFQGTFIARW